MEQALIIKKVTIDQEAKVSVVLEFAAADPDSQNNLFKLIQMQGEAVVAKLTPSQIQLDLVQ